MRRWVAVAALALAGGCATAPRPAIRLIQHPLVAVAAPGGEDDGEARDPKSSAPTEAGEWLEAVEHDFAGAVSATNEEECHDW